MNKKIGTLSALLLAASTNLFADVYNVPPANQAIIGQVQYETSVLGGSVTRVTQNYDIGYNAIAQANPYIDFTKGLPLGGKLKIPTQHLLPNLPREGIVVNLPEMRMYYYPAGTNKVYTFPIGIGKIGKTIPLAQAIVTKKVENPVWVPPDDIRQFNLAQGVVVPQIMPAGPDNPLGPYAIYMSVPTFLIHSTIFPESIGKRASFGCIRMYESDIKKFFPTVTPKIPVAIVNAPTKFGWQNDKLYVEAHTPMEELNDASDSNLPGMVHMLTTASNSEQPAFIDWQAVSYVSQTRDGLPHEVGMKVVKG